MLYCVQRYHLAHIHLQKSLDLNPKQPETMKHMAMMHYSMGKMKVLMFSIDYVLFLRENRNVHTRTICANADLFTRKVLRY